MSHTNVTIPNRYSTIDQMAEKIRLLEFQLSDKSKYINYLEAELANIPKAIEEWGYVNISYYNGKKTMRVEQVEEKK